MVAVGALPCLLQRKGLESLLCVFAVKMVTFACMKEYIVSILQKLGQFMFSLLFDKFKFNAEEY